MTMVKMALPYTIVLGGVGYLCVKMFLYARGLPRVTHSGYGALKTAYTVNIAATIDDIETIMLSSFSTFKTQTPRP